MGLAVPHLSIIVFLVPSALWGPHRRPGRHRSLEVQEDTFRILRPPSSILEGPTGFLERHQTFRPPCHGFCIKAISLILGVSYRYIYRMRRAQNEDPGTGDFYSLIDASGARERKHRRNGSRKGFPPIDAMRMFECGCESPCFKSTPQTRLTALYLGFAELSKKSSCWEREHQYLLNVMW